MWQDERKKIILRNIILGILCAAIITGLVFAFIKNEEEAEQEKEELQVYVKPQDPSLESTHMAVEDIEAEYRKDMDTVAQYLPGIVCWGDTFTAGSSGGTSYPYILQKFIDANICDIYDFRASMKIYSSEYSRIEWDNYKVRIPVVNMGVDDEDTNTILGRSGTVPFVLKNEVTIPAGTEPVEIELISQNGKRVSPLSGGNGGVNNVTIGGIEGTLTLEADNKPGSAKKLLYHFTRTSAGSEYKAAAETPVITAAAEMYKDYLHIVWMGAFEGYKDEKELVTQIKTLLARQTNNTDRYLVIGLCCKGDWGDFSSYDTAMTQAFGDHYINIRKYLCSDGVSDALGFAMLSPSKQDEMDAARGIVPPSLRSTKGNFSLNATAYKLVGKIVYERMEQMGYFNEVVDELYIKEVKKELTATNPMLFSTTAALQNW